MMQISQETVAHPRYGSVAVISPSGDIDMHESPKLRTVLLDEIAKKPGAVVIDLVRVNFIDSSGVATLVEGLKGTKGNGAAMILCGMSEKVRDVFELARLDKVFTIMGSRAEALAANTGGDQGG